MRTKARKRTRSTYGGKRGKTGSRSSKRGKTAPTAAAAGNENLAADETDEKNVEAGEKDGIDGEVDEKDVKHDGSVLGRSRVFSISDVKNHGELHPDVLAITKHFLNTMPNLTKSQLSRTKVVVLPEKGPLIDAYEAEAKRLSSLTRPILTRDMPPSTKGSDNWGSFSAAVGFATEKLGFHGTLNANILSIVTDGFKNPEALGNYGKCVYVANEARYSHTYTNEWASEKKSTVNQILGCRAILFHGEVFDDIYACNDTKRVLPFVVFQYPPAKPPKR